MTKILLSTSSMHHRRRNLNKKEYTRIDRSKYDTADGIFVDQLDVEEEPQYRRRLPWKQVALIVGFMILGAICITISILISASYFDAKYQDRVWPLLIVGILMFIPGGYYGYILICILFNRDGFTSEDIPIF